MGYDLLYHNDILLPGDRLRKKILEQVPWTQNQLDPKSLDPIVTSPPFFRVINPAIEKKREVIFLQYPRYLP